MAPEGHTRARWGRGVREVWGDSTEPEKTCPMRPGLPFPEPQHGLEVSKAPRVSFLWQL